MKITEQQNIGKLVAENYKAASIFKAYKIDYCCNGNRTIADVCKSQNLNAEQLIDKLENVLNSTATQSIDYKSWPADLLADYIEKKHHRYVEEKILEIKPLLEKLCSVHGENHPELHEIKELFMTSAGELTAHMKKEEFILFPFVRKMVQNKSGSGSVTSPQFGTVENPIDMMKHEHEAEGERFEKIAALSNNYTPPADACSTYTVTYALLKEFQEDLHLHIHLENNILFPQAIKMEKELVH
ncbi:iron-sulfur cluster repair di-iron protein [Arcticibacterium luteifluviistationis]|uniref:Iron-sulfur cluster repair di-iron protein n=1 Tax=Arcticibacterium luteifluviistationis TaxID=1784714 RepID=A0A2Z4GCJ0_9BACT|nr:iron-sulfur cluster repair di-iron protein [Arcticibacterium luteifluviistationis]AWV98810.1 iron-sulfur cluster repair di-iron protein [Arcticibacterium luteifluviistationis]